MKPLALLLVIIASPAFAGSNYTPPPTPSTAAANQAQHQLQHQMQRQGQRQSQASAQANQQNVTIQAPSGGSSSSPVIAGGAPSVNFSAPGWSLPSVGASGMDCPTVGFSAGGSGPMGGGGLGPSWISPDCNARKLAELLYNMGHSDIAMKVLSDQYPVVRNAAQDAAPAVPPEQPVKANFSDRAAWCSATAFSRWSRVEQAHHPECRN